MKRKTLDIVTEAHLVEKLEAAGDLGPAMLALPTDRQRLVVICCLDQGLEVDWTAACRAAGYRGNPNVLRVTACKLRHDERVEAAILEMSRKRLQSFVPAAVHVLSLAMKDEKAEWKDRCRTAFGILDRCGIPAASEHNINVTHVESREDKMKKILEITEKLGIDPRIFLGNMIDITPELEHAA